MALKNASEVWRTLMDACFSMDSQNYVSSITRVGAVICALGGLPGMRYNSPRGTVG